MTQRLLLPILVMLATAATSSGGDTILTDQEVAAMQESRMGGAADRVVETLKQHAAVAAHEPRAMALLAFAYLDLGEVDAADLAMGPIIKPYIGDDTLVLKALGLVLVLQDEFRRGNVYLKRAELIAPEDAEAGWERRLGEVLSYPTVERLKQLQDFDSRGTLPESLKRRYTGNAVYRVALGRLNQRQFDEQTESLLRQAIDLLPDDPALLISLANVQIERGEYQDAAALAQQLGDRFEAKMEEVQYLRGILAEREGDKEKALGFLTDAITLSQRNHVPALIEAADLSMQLDRYYEARLHLDRAIAIAPNTFRARLLFARYNVYRAENTDNPADKGLYLKEAEQHCVYAKVREPYNIENLELLEKVYTQMQARGNQKVDLDGVRQDLRVARLKAKAGKPGGR